MALTPANRPARARWRPRVAAWALWALTMLGLPVVAWLDRLLRQAGLAELTILAAVSLPWVMALVSAATVGAVLASRRPEHPVGWLLLALGLSGQLNNLANQYVHYGVMGRPGALPAASYLSGSNSSGAVLVLTCAGFIALLTPTGSLPSPRWRWWARVVVAATVVLLLARALDPHPLVPEDPTFQNPLVAPPALAGPLVVAGAVSMAIVLAGLVIAAGSLVLRLRRARGMERQQLRWLALAAAVAAVALLVAVAAGAKGNEGMVLAAVGTSVASLPLATGAAILRYRLYDLDRIISRTVAYGLLTVLLGLGYAGVVLGLGQLFGQDSSLAVAGATLAVAAAFQPARRRIQRLVDRRFNRRRYDAARTIAAFSARLREEVDLDTLSAELVAVVERTMQPTHVWLWLRPQPPSAPAGVAGAQQRR
jgi:N-terminal 7TM region of histidine kinase